MTFRPSRIALALILGGGLAGPLLGQATVLPLRNAGVATGISLSGEVGFARVNHPDPVGDDKGWAAGATLAAGLGPFGASATLARATIERDAGTTHQTTATGAASLRVFGGPLVPLSIQWQAAGSVGLDGDTHPWRGSLGIGAALTIPIPVLSIKPWVAPRADYFGGQTVGGSSLKAALSAGVDLGFLNGLGVRFAYDSRVGWDRPDEGPAGVSIGVSYAFR